MKKLIVAIVVVLIAGCAGVGQPGSSLNPGNAYDMTYRGGN